MTYINATRNFSNKASVVTGCINVTKGEYKTLDFLLK